MKSWQAEQSVLQCLVKKSALLNECKVKPGDFTADIHRQIFEAICELDACGSAVDLVTIGENIERKYKTVDMQFLVKLFDLPVSERGFTDYQNIVREAARQREAHFIGQRLVESIEGKQAGDHVAKAIRDLMALDDADQRYQYTLKEALYNGLKHVESAREKDGLVGISTGINRIDEVTGGYQDTDLNILAARPAMGKTAFALNMMLNANCSAGLISAEQGNVQAAMRFIAIQGSIESNKLRTGNLDETEFSRLSGAVIALQDREIYINDKPRISIGELVRQARDWKHNHDIKILFVDYLQKVQGSNPAYQRTEQVTEVTQSLKALARELNIPIVALAQVRRTDDRQDKRPKLGDMADASEIEKEADVIMTLYRDEVYNEDTQESGVAEIDVVKNRHGQTGVVRCQFIGKYFQFKDFEPVREMRSYA